MSNKTLSLDDRLYHYFVEHSVRDHAVLTEPREVAAQQSGAERLSADVK